MSGRSYLSIGDVLTLLRQEFPDVTISKIRFLESQGLVNPERTPSGYRKFYEQDVERLRWVLRQQREHFLPLKVIKDRLGDEPNGSETPGPVESGRPGAIHGDHQPSEPSRAPDPVLVGRAAVTSTPARTAASSRPAVPEPAKVGGAQSGRLAAEVAGTVPTRLPSGGGPSGLYDQEDPGVLTRWATPDDGSNSRTPDRVPAPTRGVTPAPATGAVPTTGQESRRPTPATPSSGTASPPLPTPSPSDPPPAKVDGGAPRPPKPVAAASRAAGKPAADPPASPAGAPSGSGAGTAKSKAADAGAISDMAGMSGASLTLDELASASGLDILIIEELCDYGLLSPSRVGGGEYFDEEALAVANLVAGFARFGIEPRHLRLYKNAADREAGFVEQIVLPLVRQRNPEARAKANETADELIRLGQGLRSSLLRKALHDLLGN
ncbi:MAG TPA: MerR family transcriptional regulator [Acidimicrobiales bacterium]|nr:MerR family transcriptional regulator [Acidimicrobiales bacterium]